MDDEYRKIARRKSVIDGLLRLLHDRFIDGDAPAKERIVCEELPYGERETDQATILEMENELAQRSHDLDLELKKFVQTRRENVKQPEPQGAPSKAKGGNKRKPQPRAAGARGKGRGRPEEVVGAGG